MHAVYYTDIEELEVPKREDKISKCNKQLLSLGLQRQKKGGSRLSEGRVAAVLIGTMDMGGHNFRSWGHEGGATM